jgi:hypothetical protein
MPITITSNFSVTVALPVDFRSKKGGRYFSSAMATVCRCLLSEWTGETRIRYAAIAEFETRTLLEQMRGTITVTRRGARGTEHQTRPADLEHGRSRSSSLAMTDRCVEETMRPVITKQGVEKLDVKSATTRRHERPGLPMTRSPR